MERLKPIAVVTTADGFRHWVAKNEPQQILNGAKMRTSTAVMVNSMECIHGMEFSAVKAFEPLPEDFYWLNFEARLRVR